MLLFLVLSAAALSVVRAQEDEPAPAQNDARMAALMSVMNMMNMPPVVRNVTVQCHADHMMMAVETEGAFTGKIYPKGLSKKDGCVSRYVQTDKVRFGIPLDPECGTVLESSVTKEGNSEAVNTIVIQPHSKLVTMMARAYSVRCLYDYSGRTVGNGVNVTMIGTTPFVAEAPPPFANLEIYRVFKDDADADVHAEWVSIGDLLEMRVEMGEDAREYYGMTVKNCRVFDGMGMEQEQLIDDDGCSVQPGLFPMLTYENYKTRAWAIFKAHKFPFTTSVGYECEVDFCLKASGECDEIDLEKTCSEKVERQGRIIANNDELNQPSFLERLFGSSPSNIQDERNIEVGRSSEESTVEVGNSVRGEVTTVKTSSSESSSSSSSSEMTHSIGLSVVGTPEHGGETTTSDDDDAVAGEASEDSEGESLDVLMVGNPLMADTHTVDSVDGRMASANDSEVETVISLRVPGNRTEALDHIADAVSDAVEKVTEEAEATDGDVVLSVSTDSRSKRQAGNDPREGTRVMKIGRMVNVLDDEPQLSGVQEHDQPPQRRRNQQRRRLMLRTRLTPPDQELSYYAPQQVQPQQQQPMRVHTQPQEPAMQQQGYQRGATPGQTCMSTSVFMGGLVVGTLALIGALFATVFVAYFSNKSQSPKDGFYHSSTLSSLSK